MTERVVLELSDTTLQRAKDAARQANRPLEAILIEWLDRASEAVSDEKTGQNEAAVISTDTAAEFRTAWKQAMTGDTLTWEQFLNERG